MTPTEVSPAAEAEAPVAPPTPISDARETARPEAASEPDRSDVAVEPERGDIGGEPDQVEHEPGPGTNVRAPSPHSPLNTPIGEPDPTEWPDPYERREDPRDLHGDEMMTFEPDAGHPPTGATSTSEPHPAQDPEAEPSEGPKRDKVDR